MVELMAVIADLKNLKKIVAADLLEPMQSSEKAAEARAFVDGYVSGVDRSIDTILSAFYESAEY